VSAQAARVVQLTDFASRYPGSFVPALVALARGGREQGLSFQAVLRSGAERHEWYRRLPAEGIEPLVLPPTGRRAQVRWLGGLLAAQPGPVVLHSHFAYWDVAAVLAAQRAPRPVAVIWHRHGTVSGPLARARRGARFALLGRWVDAHLCVSPAVRNEAISLHSPPARTLLVPNGIELERFVPAAACERARARAELGLGEHDEVLLAFAWDWQVKGGELLLQALARLRERGRDPRLLLVGAPEIAAARVRALGLEGSVLLLEPRAEVRALYAAATLFASASAREGMPFALLESIACGVPVVASDIEPHRDLAQKLPACRLAARDAVAFAEALETALQEPPRARQHRLERSRALLEREADLGVWAARVLEIYRQVLAKVAPAA
jgi:glycosyltransferase involved in cell wall biosynthesis